MSCLDILQLQYIKKKIKDLQYETEEGSSIFNSLHVTGFTLLSALPSINFSLSFSILYMGKHTQDNNPFSQQPD